MLKGNSIKLRSGNTLETEVLKSFLEENKNIKELRLKGYWLSDGCIEVITDFLYNNNTLECLDLQNCGIAKDGIISFSKAIRFNSFLKEVHIAGNEGLWDVEALGELANAIKNNKSIVYLYTYNHETDCQNIASNFYFPDSYETRIATSKSKKTILEEVYKNKITHDQITHDQTHIGDSSELYESDFNI